MKSPDEELLEIVDRLFQGVPKNRNEPYLKDLVRAQDLVRILALPLNPLHIVFDGPPGPEAGRFVEVETPDGKSINAGEWRQVGDFWHLVIR